MSQTKSNQQRQTIWYQYVPFVLTKKCILTLDIFIHKKGATDHYGNGSVFVRQFP